ncbi:MAG: PEP-CTERM sorting domain-containing protein [Fimbriimonadaceae bacterium]
MKRTLFLAAICACAAIASAQAFDVLTVDFSENTATGTSNGIAWTFSGSHWSARTVTDNTFTGFSGSYHDPSLASTDVLHTGQSDPIWTFDVALSEALIYLSDNSDGNYVHWWDFGAPAEALSGDVEVDGTRFRITSQFGGLVKITVINSNVLATSDIGDGNDIAILATPVPEPTTLAALGVGGLALLSRKSAKR